MTGGIILAAGSSSRMGQSKQMLDILGERLLVKTVRAVSAAGLNESVVVLGFNEKEHREILMDTPFDVVFNPLWEKGMGSSIKAGLRHLIAKNPALECAVIFVCDQPMLTPEIISGVLQKYLETKKPIIASGYSDVPGVPVSFDKTYFPSLLALPDEQGAKRLILQNLSDVVVVPFPGGEIDLDTMEEYTNFLGREARP